MSTVTKADPAIPAGSAHPLEQRRPLGDRGFAIATLACGLLVLVILLLIAITTTNQAWPWFKAEGWGIFGKTWNPTNNQFGEATGIQRDGLMGLGVLLFIFTIIVHVIARGVEERSARRARGT